MSDTAKRDKTLHVLREVVHGDPYHRQFMPLLDEIDRLRAENSALKVAVERVRALHHNRMRGAYACAECRDDYPCPTIRALEGTP